MLEDAPKMRSMCRYITVIVVLLFAPIAWAQEESWGDWAKQCEPAGGGAERCYIIQTVQADDRPVMVIVVAYSPQRDRIAAMIDVPLEILNVRRVAISFAFRLLGRSRGVRDFAIGVCAVRSSR